MEMPNYRYSFLFRGLVASSLSIALVGLSAGGCARKIQGQVFIVTRSGESIKLGLVEVCAYNRNEIDEALKKVDERLKKSREGSHVISEKVDDLVKQASAAEDYNLTLDLMAPQDLLKRRENYLFSSQPYFAALPNPVACTKTDTDGNFVISVPLFGQFVIGARARRSVGDETEHYAWLIITDHPAGSQKLMLSNDNLTSAGGENSLLKTEGDEDDAEDISKEQAEAALKQIVAKHPHVLPDQPKVEQPEVNSVLNEIERSTAQTLSNDPNALHEQSLLNNSSTSGRPQPALSGQLPDAIKGDTQIHPENIIKDAPASSLETQTLPEIQAPPPPGLGCVILNRDVEVSHGIRKIVIPKDSKLPVVGRGSRTVAVRFQDEIETIPKSATSESK